MHGRTDRDRAVVTLDVEECDDRGSWGFRDQQSQPLDAAEDQSEQGSEDRHLRQREHHAPGVKHDLASDLDEFVPQRGQRPMFHARRQRQPPQEVAQVVRQGKQLLPYLVVHEVVATQPRPVQGQLALLDALLGRAPAVVKLGDTGRAAAKIW